MLESSNNRTSQTQLAQPPIGTINQEIHGSWLKSQEQFKELAEINANSHVSYQENAELKEIVSLLRLKIDTAQSANINVGQLKTTLENELNTKFADEIKKRETEWRKGWSSKEKTLQS